MIGIPMQGATAEVQSIDPMASASPPPSSPPDNPPDIATAAAPAEPPVAPEASVLEPSQPGSPQTPQMPQLPQSPKANPAADGWPADTRLTYRLGGFYRGELHGSARVQWQREQGRYQVQLALSVALFDLVSLVSQGEVSDMGLLPRTYEEQAPGSVRRVNIDNGFVKFQDGSQLPQPPAVQDTASQFVELSHRFSSGMDSLKVGANVSLWLARPGGMDLWVYDVVEEETLQTPELGAVQAFHLVPRPLATPRGPIMAEMWFAPSLQYLPVRVKISLGSGNFVDLMVERIDQSGPPAAGQTGVLR
jgi:hypothetical protein